MIYAIGVIAFVAALLLSVMLHEAGHFVMAKAFGMKASRFFVGFGPTIWSFQKGETEYGIKAIPAGGFVKIEGMTSLEEIAPEDEDRAFYKQPAGKRTIVLAAGSIVHFIIAIVLVFGYLAIGHQDPLIAIGTTKIAAVEKCVSDNGVCTKKDAAAPALHKLRAGDDVTAINGQRVLSYLAMVHLIQRSAGKQLALTVTNHGATRIVDVTPVAIKDGGKLVGKIGIEGTVIAKPVSFAGSFPRTFTVLGDFVKETGTALSGLPHELGEIFQGKPTGLNGAVSIVGAAEASGQEATATDETLGEKIGSLVLLMASLNLFVGIFNLLPLLPLDGGHIGILVFEKARTRVAKILGRNDPGRVDIMKVLPLTYAVVGLLVAVSLLLIYSNLRYPVTLQ